jgi:hypothetical protein
MSVRVKLGGFAAILVAVFALAYVAGTHAPILW